ncbi:MAG: hypothetical protein F6K48_28170 [Okeania sp. SIO3H1]|nr:hypothetical protein [Okeania sp. SIO3H1]
MQKLPSDKKTYISLMALSYSVAIKRLAQSQGTNDITTAIDVVSQAFSLLESLDENSLERVASLVHKYSNSDLISFCAFHEELKILSSELHLNLTKN